MAGFDIKRPNGEQMGRLIDAVTRYSAGQSKEVLDATYQAILDGSNTTEVFKQWWPLSNTGDSKYERLSRFARMLAGCWADKVYTLRSYPADTSALTEMTPMDDLAGKSAAQLCTEETTPVPDWADEDPMTWYVRANALSLADGTMNVLAVEGEPEFDIAGNTAPVYTFCAALWTRKWTDGEYNYQSWCTSQRGGFAPYAGDVGLDNKKRDLTWRPTFGGGYDSAGRLGSGKGQKPFNRKSANAGISSARTVTAYEGLWNDADTIWALDMWRLRHFDLENSDICNGCQSYDFSYTVAVSEDNVTRVIVTTAQGANFQVGSNVMLGSGTSGDRNTASWYALADNATILSKEDVTIEGTEYVALNLDLAAPINTTAGTTKVTTAPWNAGNTENLPGHKDGACYSLTAGRNPMRVQGVELMDGAYAIGLDPLYNVTNYASNAGDYAVYECRDSENLAGSVTANYVDTGIGYSKMPKSWQYVKEFVETSLAILFPKTIGGSSTGYVKSAFCGANSAGVRCPWRFGYLNHGAAAGLGCESGNFTPSAACWNGRPRLSGSGKKRGEWAA